MSSKINSHDIEDKSISNDKLENDYLNLINEVDNKIDNIDLSDYATVEELNEIEAKIPIITSGTTDLTAGVSELPDSHVYLVYE